MNYLWTNTKWLDTLLHNPVQQEDGQERRPGKNARKEGQERIPQKSAKGNNEPFLSDLALNHYPRHYSTCMRSCVATIQ